MKITLSALKEYVALDASIDVEAIARTFTLSGIEVEFIEQAAPSVIGGFVVLITKKEPHPTKKDLSVCTVFDGKKEHTVVSSASNIVVGMKTAFAPIGAKVGKKEPITITKAVFDSVSSDGTMLSEKEMGITSDTSGLVDLGEYEVGARLETLFNDTVLELGLTPNLGHVLSVLGVARQLSALLGVPLKAPKFSHAAHWKQDPTLVQVVEKELVPAYSALVISGVKVQKAPLKMRVELERAGIHSVNGIVDVMNFVMLRVGQPLHAFDFNTIEGKALTVAKAEGNEKMPLLDGLEVLVPKQAIIIKDKNSVCALGGVMGALSHAVSGSTESILVEAAYFEPMSIRRTRKALNLFTDAAKLFERGIDPLHTVRALEYTYELLHQTFPEAKAGAFCSHQFKKFAPKKIVLRRARASEILGIDVSLSDIELCFSRLGFTFAWEGSDAVAVEIPPYRHDIFEEIDLVEELWQVLQMNVVPKGLIPHVTPKLPDSALYTFSEKVRNTCLREGLQEFVTCTLISPSLVDKVKNHPINANEIIRVCNPMSEEQSILRPSLLPSLLDVVKNNMLVKNHSISGFELSQVHFKRNDKYVEQPVVGIVLCGDRAPRHFEGNQEEVDFFDLKGIVENLLVAMSIDKVAFVPSEFEVFHPHKQASIVVGNLQIGALGEIHPSITRSLDTPKRVFIAEINVIDMQKCPKKEIRFSELDLFPASERDWTVTLPEEVSFDQFASRIRKEKEPLLESFELVSIFRDEKIGKNKKNVSVRFIFRNKERTMEQEEVENAFQGLIGRVSSL